MRTTDTIVIGAGQAGLAVSRCLTDAGRDHVILERGRIGDRWRTDTWDSLHLLTPNWMNTLPGQEYEGPAPDAFSSAAAFVEQLERYAASYAAPVEEHSPVVSLTNRLDCFEIVTDRAVWRAPTVVVATGWCDRPAVPAAARSVAAGIHQVVPADYRDPGSIPGGGVLVVGASATGVQLADELRAAGREVTLAVGRHTRMPRRYRGADIYWWMHRIGLLDRTIDEMPDQLRARREPSAQLTGGPRPRGLDLCTLQAAGVRLTGRVVGVDGHRVRLAPDLPATTAAADQRMRRLLGAIDQHIDQHGFGLTECPTGCEPARSVVSPSAGTELDLRSSGIRSVLWATGHRRSYPWLHLPVLDRDGEIRQHRGRTAVPGLYVLGQRFQHHRNSGFIGGVGRDAAYIADHIGRL